MKASPLEKKVDLVVQTPSFGRQRSNFLETKLAFKEGQVKPSTPGCILDPRRALLASNLFRKRKEKETEKVEKRKPEPRTFKINLIQSIIMIDFTQKLSELEIQ